MKKLQGILLKFAITLVVIYSGNITSQVIRKDKDFDPVSANWYSSLESARLQAGASKEDFEVFSRFWEKRVDSIRTEFILGMRRMGSISGVISPSDNNDLNNEWLTKQETALIELYKKYKSIKKEFPSSVEEYEHPSHRLMGICDSAGCDNIDFESGTLNGWSAYYAYDNNSAGNPYFNVTLVTGGPVGPVTQAANDAFTSNPAYYNATVGPNPSPDYQIKITSGALGDALVPSVSQVSPFGGKYSAMLGDSTLKNYGVAILSKTFYVTKANDNMTYQYSVFLENPLSHSYYQQPFFKVALLDQFGDTIPYCGEYTVVSSGGLAGFKGIYYAPSADSVYYKNWTIVSVPLKKYVGECVTIIFESGDCGLGGHFGYAYVDASCAPLGVLTSSPALCGQKTITISAPPGFSGYQWTGPAGGIVGSDSTSSITVDSAGKYQVVLIPVTGASCSDTLSITIPKAAGPPPIPSFTADTVCLGSPTQFVNTSNPGPGPGVKYYWDFYNLGTYSDSTTNPMWTYTLPGTYSVKLYEINNGCGADTIIKVRVDSNVEAGFTDTNTCFGSPVKFTNTSVGAASYTWNFGDPLSGPGNNSALQNPTHIFTSAGTYTVSLIAYSPGKCPADTFKQTVTIVPPPKPIITGNDSICAGGSTTLTASAAGATSYIWTPGPIPGASIFVSPFSTTTYTVSASNGLCSHDTTATVYVLPIPVPGITTKPDTICIGDSSHLIGSGGPAYSWSTGATMDSIWVKPVKDSTFTLTVTKNKCSAAVFTSIYVESKTLPTVSSRDTICFGDTAKLTASGANTYLWSTGATTSSIIVKPPVGTNNYWVICKNKCFNDTIKKTVFVMPIPVAIITPSTDSICPNTNAVLIGSGGGTYLWSTGQTTFNITVHPGMNTTYTLTVSNGRCTADTTFTLKTKPAPVITITGTKLICQGDSITLSATAPGGGTYKWSTGALTSSISVLATPGIDYFWVAMTKGCSDTAYDTVHVKPVTPLTVCCDTTIQYGVSVELDASGATGYVWIPETTVSCFTCPEPIATPTATTTYTVVGTDSNGCKAFGYVTITIECAKYIIPNVFTPPDGDAKNPENNVFLIKATPGYPYSIEIYDRWGVKIFQSSDPTNPWNGKVDNTGQMVSNGVYYYILKSTCNGVDRQEHGFVQVIRSN